LDNRATLAGSQAGMRFIAQMTFFNQGDFDRLRTFITYGYDPALLDDQSVDDRLHQLQSIYKTLGKMRVSEIISADKYRVAMLLEAQHASDLYYTRIKVGEDYPHHVIQYIHRSYRKNGGQEDGV
jgi:hypothetical protein